MSSDKPDPLYNRERVEEQLDRLEQMLERGGVPREEWEDVIDQIAEEADNTIRKMEVLNEQGRSLGKLKAQDDRNWAQSLEELSKDHGGPYTVRVNYEDSQGGRGRRWFLRVVAALGIGVIGAILGDEYEVDVDAPADDNGAVPGRETRRPGAGDAEPDAQQVQGRELETPLEREEYEFFILDDEDIWDLANEVYVDYNGEIGQLGSEIREAYDGENYGNLTLGFDDDTWRVQMTGMADELLVDVGLSQNQYEKAKEEAQKF